MSVETSSKASSALEIENKVKELEEMFTDRYTEQDEEFMKTVASPLPDPPCVKNWFMRQRGNWSRGGHRGSGDRRDDNRYGNRDNYHGNRDYHGNQRQYHDHYSNRGGHHQRYDNYDRHGNQRRDDRRYQPY